MKHFVIFLGMVLLSACTHTPITKPDIKIERPTLIKSGYMKLSNNYQYYIDTHSIKRDQKDSTLLHFDLIENLDEPLFLIPQKTDLFARSIVRHKTLNCSSNRLLQPKPNEYFGNFWGEMPLQKEIAKYTTKKYMEPPITLNKNSEFYALEKVLCQNLKRTW